VVFRSQKAARDRIEGPADSLRWLDAGAVPRSPVATSDWRVAKRFAAAGVAAIETLVPAGELVSDWSELLESSTDVAGQELPPATRAANTERYVRSRQGNGRLEFEVLHETADTVLYSWSLAGSALTEDQFDVTLQRQRGAVVATVRYAARSRYTPELGAKAQELVLGVAAAPPVDQDVDEEHGARSYSADEIDAVRAALARPLQALDQVDPRRYYGEVLAGVRRERNPELWASFSALIGMQLLRSPFLPVEQTLETASIALRRALEVLSPEQHAELCAAVVRSLSTAYARLAVEVDRGYLPAAEYTLGVAADTFQRLGSLVDAALVWHTQANLRRFTRAGDPAVLRDAVDLLRRAGATLESHGETLAWASVQTDLGDALVAVADLASETAEGADALAQARATWQALAMRLSTDTALGEEDGGTWAGVLSDVDERLKQLGRRGLPEPTFRTPPGTKTRGEALYLRPLLSSGGLRFENRFVNPEALDVQFAVEPDPISLEATLYRVLGPHFEFTTIGGPSDALGASRMQVVGGHGWQGIFHMLLERASLVVVVPEDSPGLRWELEQILAAGRQASCLFVFPPRSDDVDTAELAEGGSRLLRELGLETPDYDPAGRLFRVRDDGSLAIVVGFDEIWNDTLADRL
jgi:hypothetical protein